MKRGEREERKEIGEGGEQRERRGEGGRGRGGRRGREDKGEGGMEAERGEYIASTVVHGPCLSKCRWDMLVATYSEQPCNVRCMSSIHTPSRAWDTLTRLGGLW